MLYSKPIAIVHADISKMVLPTPSDTAVQDSVEAWNPPGER